MYICAYYNKICHELEREQGTDYESIWKEKGNEVL